MSSDFIDYTDPDAPFYVTILTSSIPRDQVVALISESFALTNPFFQAARLTPQDLITYGEWIYDRAIKDGLSLVALLKSTNEVIGCWTGEDLTTAEKMALPEDHPAAPIFAILGAVSYEHYEHDRPGPVQYGEVFKMGPAAVKRGYQRYRVSSALGLCLYMNTVRLGYRRSLGPTTHPATEQKARSSGLVAVKSVDPKTFEYPKGSGRYPFKDADVPTPTLFLNEVALRWKSVI